VKFVGFDPQIQRFLGGLQNYLQGLTHISLDFLLDPVKREPCQDDHQRYETAGQDDENAWFLY
jgi:hypothetical protein